MASLGPDVFLSRASIDGANYIGNAFCHGKDKGTELYCDFSYGHQCYNSLSLVGSRVSNRAWSSLGSNGFGFEDGRVPESR